MNGNQRTSKRAVRPFMRVLTALLVMLISFVAAPRAAAEQSDPSVRVELTSVVPNVLRLNGDLVINGRVTNTSDEPLDGLRAHLWSARGPFTNLDALKLALDSEPYDYYGAVPTIDPRGVVDLTADRPLEPGETREFTVMASNDEGNDPLHLNSVNVGYLVGVQVRQTASWRVTTIGSARTFIGSLMPNAKAEASTVVVLTSRPRMIAQPEGESALFADEKLATELRGPLDDLLTLAETDGATAIIDPALFDEVIAMAQGYDVGTAGKAGVYSDVAKAWLARVRDVVDTGTAYRTLYGSPDVAAAFSSKTTAPLNDAAAALPSTHELAGLPLAIVPAAGTVNAELVAFLEQASPDVIIADTVDIAYTVQRAGDLPIIATAPDLYAGGPSPAPVTSVPQRLGRIAAHQIISAERGQPNVALVRTQAEADLIMQTNEWRTNVPLSDVIAKAPRRDVAYRDATPSAPVPGTWVTELDSARAGLRLWGELTDQTPVASTIEHMVMAKAWNPAFAGHGDALVWVDAATGAQRGAFADGTIEIHTTPRWVLTSDVNALPLTVTNTHTVPVQVKVHFRSQNATRINIDDTDVITVPAGESTTVRVAPTARANGTVGITAQVTTAAGTPVSDPVAITVTANSAGRVGWLIIIGSGAVLAVATFLRVGQVRRARSAEPAIVPVNELTYSAQPGGPMEFAEQQRANLPQDVAEPEREGLD